MLALRLKAIAAPRALFRSLSLSLSLQSYLELNFHVAMLDLSLKAVDTAHIARKRLREREDEGGGQRGIACAAALCLFDL